MTTQHIEPQPGIKRPSLRYEDLQQRFPALFGAGVNRPMKIGLKDDLLRRLGDECTAEELKRMVARKTHSADCQLAVQKGDSRYDLDGVEAGEVTPSQQEFAGKLIERLKFGSAYAERTALLKAVEASGLQPEQYRLEQGLGANWFESRYEKAVQEREQRRRERVALVEKYEKSGLGQDEFLGQNPKVGLRRLQKAMEKVGAYRQQSEAGGVGRAAPEAAGARVGARALGGGAPEESGRRDSLPAGGQA